MKRAALRQRPLLLASFVALCLGAVQDGEADEPILTVQPVLDLRRDGVNVVAFSSASRELFVSHPVEYRKLYQWNIGTRKLVHSYSCPGGDARWNEVAVSPDGTLLVASTYPLGDPFRKSQVLFIDTRTHRVRYTAEYEYLVRAIRFDRSGRLIWMTTTDHGPDDFVYDRDGARHRDFKPTDFDPETKGRLWDVPASKGGPPEGLFYRDASGTVHRLLKDPLNQNYALSVDGAYIATSTWDRRVRVWRTSDLQEVFNEVIGAHPVSLVYDRKENRLLILDGIDGNRFLRAVWLPHQTTLRQQDGAANGSQPIRSETNSTSSTAGSRR